MNIVLIGMSGAGKSTLGVLLAKSLGMDYLDTDIVLQQQTGRLLQEMIETDGIESFIKAEERVISGISQTNCVIATGGSVIYSAAAMQALKNNGRILYLHVPFKEINRRIKNSKTRGIVLKSGNSLKEEYEERVPLYRKYCDQIVDCSGRGIERCAELVLENLKQNR